MKMIPVGEQTAAQPPPEAARGSQKGQAPPGGKQDEPADPETEATQQCGPPNELGGTAAINSNTGSYME